MNKKKKQHTDLQLRFDFDAERQENQPEQPVECHETAAAEITLEDLFRAYYDCRRHKRKTANALKFEMNCEENLIRLRDEINSGTYVIGRSVAFIVDKPVKREIFAAGFRDRIVHHFLINKLNHLFEKEFICDSYSCRKGKGTLFGVKRLYRFIRSCSENYTKEAYILKLDLQGFFMSIDRKKLFDMLFEFIGCNYHEPDRDLLIRLTEQIVMNDCTEGCLYKSPAEKWTGLPANKSLLLQKKQGVKDRGLPIGNLTSQIYANFYLSRFDHFMKSELGLKYYGRYVDDFFVVHRDRRFLSGLIPLIEGFLSEELHLTLHPGKRRIHDYRQGMPFVGACLLPGRIYISRRTKGNFYHKIARYNSLIRKDRKALSPKEMEHFITSVNSYLGFMRHYKTFRLRKKMLYAMSARFDRYMHPAASYTKLVGRFPLWQIQLVDATFYQ
jgi:retron-type reverse transcriptase